MGKIRVICSDPYATDCSSDDEESIEDEKPINEKLFVQEISASIPTIPTVSTSHLDFLAKQKSDSLFRVDESESKSFGDCLHRIILALPAQKPEDIPRKKSGISSIQNRLKKSSVAQKTQPNTTNSSSQEDGSPDANPTCINQAINTNVAKNHRSLGAGSHPGVRITSSGKWGVKIRHPLRKNQVWLGTFGTIEEAINIYNEKRLEYASLRFANIKHKKHCMLRAKHKGKTKQRTLIVEGVTVRETLSGKWGAWIRDPVSNHKVWLGSCDTPEEAAESYNKKKLEYCATPEEAVESYNKKELEYCSTPEEAVESYNKKKLEYCATPEEAVESYNKKKLEFDSAHDCDSAGKELVNDTANQESNSVKKETDADVASPAVVGLEGQSVKKYKGVRPSTSGRWTAQINDPFSKRKLYLGTFNTAEEAADAFKKKRHELDALVSLVKKQKREANALAHNKKKAKSKLKSKKVVIIEESAKAENSTVTVVNSQDSEGSNKNNDKQVPSSSLSAELQKPGIGIINGYGQLIGEYSRLDDELWLTGPGEDDECVGDLARDQKPPSPFLMNC